MKQFFFAAAMLLSATAMAQSKTTTSAIVSFDAPTPPPLPKSWWDRNSIYVYLGAGALATIVIVAIITSQISKPVKGA